MNIEEFKEWIKIKHTGQIRWYSGIDYHLHPFAVAELTGEVVEEIGEKSLKYMSNERSSLFASALAHDVVEDCFESNEAGFLELEAIFKKIHCIDYKLSMEIIRHVTEPDISDRGQKLVKYMSQMLNFNKESMILKTCDLWHNSHSLQEDAKNFEIPNEKLNKMCNKWLDYVRILNVALTTNTKEFKSVKTVLQNRLDVVKNTINEIIP